uniref:BZIP domain-containing protein n=1 Tax=Hippocampus comes TaxID=109280 RepID=A0A3Q2YV21_HIPCM
DPESSQTFSPQGPTGVSHLWSGDINLSLVFDQHLGLLYATVYLMWVIMDATYWQRRLKNNESAKRSRDKRRLHDFMLERHVAALREENIRLRAQLLTPSCLWVNKSETTIAQLDSFKLDQDKCKNGIKSFHSVAGVMNI